MAAHSNRSPSPLSSRPINPNPKNPEINSTIRRSFTGNSKPSLLTNQRRFDPITPANSPSDFARRRPSVVKICEEKENDEKDCVLKASKLHSPAKGFMAPTISAASKFTPSPRKKVLVERNEPVRTSISFSDGKAMFFSSNVSQDLEPKNEAFSDSNLAGSENKKPVVDTHPVSKPCKKVTFSTESAINDPDSRKHESIAPLDADPSLPPYDPKTNYLSPRPQFIRYKPNPRVEILKGKGLDSDELEYSLMAEIFSEGFSDSDEGNDESQMNKEVTASEDMVIGLDEEIEAADAHASEPPSLSLPVSTASSLDEISEEEFVGKKPRSISRLMCFSVVLALLVACVSVSVTLAPSFDEPLFIKDLSLSDLSGSLYEQSRAVAASARLHLGSVAASSASIVMKLVEGEKRAPVQFMNLTDLQENAWKEAYFLKRVEDVEEEELDTEMEEEEAYADEELDLDAEIDEFQEEEADSGDDYFEMEEYDIVAATEETVIQTEMDRSAAMEISPDSAQLESEYSHDIQIPTDMVSMQMDQPAAAVPQNQETEVEAAAIEVEISQGDINVGASDNADTIASDQITANVIIGVAIAGVVGVAALAYKRISSSSANVVQVEPIVSKQRGTKKPEAIQQEKECSESWETQSEMSSSYQYERSGGANEVESSERKARKYYSKRESLASSTESPSYGSFTTYERIPVKINGYGDEEMMTPVRRSSRIRKQVTSSS
ncbi:uncharacterized protein LOC131005233 [Salvia miltiorrhiza]|uniref:uncharacterized protein LOC131005233 n=1 Tax=Salvia miltiorrhiza TaxID=226208 RepID=UPI0025AD1BA9|nr:uncharacterized protein LOC131005233 [Salvia miltiorrhiza]